MAKHGTKKNRIVGYKPPYQKKKKEGVTGMILMTSECTEIRKYTRTMEDTYQFPLDTTLDDIDTRITKMYSGKLGKYPIDAERKETLGYILVTVIWYDKIHSELEPHANRLPKTP